MISIRRNANQSLFADSYCLHRADIGSLFEVDPLGFVSSGYVFQLIVRVKFEDVGRLVDALTVMLAFLHIHMDFEHLHPLLFIYFSVTVDG